MHELIVRRRFPDDGIFAHKKKGCAMRFEFPLIMLSPDQSLPYISGKTIGSAIVTALALETSDASIAAVSFLVCISGTLAAIGGIGAALRQYVKEKKWDGWNVFCHIVNMGILGMSVSLLAIAKYGMDGNTKYWICGVAGCAGLVGLPIIEPLLSIFTEWMKKFQPNP